MKTELNETIQDDSKPILQLNRQLLPIDKYAAREGVSRGIVEECGRLGILQIRKYKGQTYIVDVPLSPYLNACEDFPFLQENKKTAIADTVANNQSACGQTTAVKKIAELVQSIESNAPADLGSGVKEKIVNGASWIVDSGTSHEPRITNHESRTTVARDQGSGFGDQIGEGQRQPKCDIRYTSAKRIRQAAARIVIIVCIFAALLAGLWFYLNQSINRSRLDRASANIKTIYNDSVQTSQQLAAFQNKLVEATAELELAKKDLNSNKDEIQTIRAEVKNLQNELIQIRQGLQSIDYRNTAALGQLQEQLRQITEQISKFVDNNKDVSSPQASSK
jgi:hypothetical protein